MKKFWKIVAAVVAVALIAAVCWFTNALVGNPVSKALAKKGARDYLRENFSGTDYYVERVDYDFKFGRYYARILSDSSVDTQFSLYINFAGKVYFDTYDSVLKGYVTARRLDTEYREWTDRLFEDPSFPYGGYICYGTLEIFEREAIENAAVTDAPEYAIVLEDLILDHVYNIGELGAKAGHLVIYVETDNVTAAEAARIMLDIRQRMDAAGITFYALDLVVEHPLPEEGMRPDGDVRAEGFLYTDIVEDGLEERIAQADAELDAYYEEMDKMGK